MHARTANFTARATHGHPPRGRAVETLTVAFLSIDLAIDINMYTWGMRKRVFVLPVQLQYCN